MILSKPHTGETLYVYLAVSEHIVSDVLVREEKRRQSPIYSVNKTLLEVETQYNQLEKLVLALVIAARTYKMDCRTQRASHQLLTMQGHRISGIN